MPSKKSSKPKPITLVIDGDAGQTARDLFSYRRSKSAIEKDEKRLKERLEEQLKIHIDEVLADETGNTKVEFVVQDSNLKVTLVHSSTTRIDGQKLLELGVKPEIVEAATVTSHHVQIRTTEDKER